VAQSPSQFVHVRRFRLKAHFLPIRQSHRLPIARDVASSLLDQDLVLIVFGSLRTMAALSGARDAVRPPHHLRPRTLHKRRRRQIHRARAHRDRNIGLLLIVRRVLFDHNQRILFDV
jgi:hypothetical protein